MSFAILYVEDETKDYEQVENAINEHNKKARTDAIEAGEGEFFSNPLYIDCAKSPDSLYEKLNHSLSFDLVLGFAQKVHSAQNL